MPRLSRFSRGAAPLGPNDLDGAAASGGVDVLIAAASQYAHEALAQGAPDGSVIRRLGDEFAFIRLEDIWHPLRFLRQMEGNPPRPIGTQGFNPALVDDHNPARHYMAFVFLGYWLPRWVAVAILWLWEVAGFVRYGGEWSWPDIVSGQVGIRHGALARRYGVVVLPGLIAAEVAARSPSQAAEEETVQTGAR